VEAVISDQSVAVLRFTDMSTAKDQAALCEGIAEEILNKLAQIRDLKVIERTSSFLFDSNTMSIREIGQHLGVRNVLEGSVDVAGDQIQITAQLTECESEFHRWSESYMREQVDVFAIYDEVARDIGRELKVIIGGGDELKIARPPTQSFPAYNLLMQARFKYGERAQPRDAFPLVEQALDLDPGYAEAHSYKSFLFWAQAEMGHVPAEQGYIASRKAAERALELDPELASAHSHMGLIHERLDLDFRLAAESYREAERFGAGPNPHWLMTFGRYQEALEVYQQWDERNPSSAGSKVFVGRALDRLGRIDEASQVFEDAFRLGPKNNFVLSEIVTHYLSVQDLDQAARVVEESKGSRQILRWAKAAIAREQGDQQEAQVLVEEWVRDRDARYIRASNIESMFYRLANYEEHIHWFAVREQEKDLLSALPVFLRDTPDYWEKLRGWALSKPDKTRERLEMIDQHRARIDRITEKMAL